MLGNLLRKQASRPILSTVKPILGFSHLPRHKICRSFSRFSGNSFKTPSYRPKSRLFFKDGKLLLASVMMRGYYLFAVVSCTAMTLLFILSARKLANYSSRSAFGLLFYGTLALTMGFGARSIFSHMRNIITKMWLSQTGKSVFIRKGFPIGRIEEVAIKDISLPETIPPNHGLEGLLNVAYPVFIKNEMLWVLKETERKNQELFSAVFNGMVIDTEPDANEIVIE
jgi:hypothetical protein